MIVKNPPFASLGRNRLVACATATYVSQMKIATAASLEKLKTWHICAMKNKNNSYEKLPEIPFKE